MMIINNIEWYVISVPKNDDNLWLEEKYHMGVTDFYNRKIYIDNSLALINKKYVLTHEITHALLCSYGFQLKDEFNQEELCEFVAYNLNTINNYVNELM